MCLSCYCLCKQGFSSSWRAYKKRSLWKICTNFRIFLRIMKKIHNLLQSILCLLFPGYILKCDSRFAFRINFCIGFSEGHSISAAHTFCHHAAHQLPNDDKHENGEYPGHKDVEKRRFLWLYLTPEIRHIRIL